MSSIEFTIQIGINLIAGLIILLLEPRFKSKVTGSKFVYFYNKYNIKLILLHLFISYLILYFGTSYNIAKLIDNGQLSLDIKLLTFLLTINILVWFTRMKDSQISLPILIQPKRAGRPKFEIYKLKNPSSNEKLELTWETFGKGVENVSKYVKQLPGFYPDIIFGINETGIMIASFLSGKSLNRCPVGLIKTGGLIKGKRKIEIINFPDGIKPESICIVDGEIKSGLSIKSVFDELKSKFGKEIEIFYIVLGGVIGKNTIINKSTDFGWELTNEDYKPDLLAFYSDKPGFDPPCRIR